MTASQVAEAVKEKRVTAMEVLETTLARIQARDSVLNAFTTVTAVRARQKAAEIDATIAAGGDPGPLAGATFAVKNLIDIKGVSTLAGAKINADLPPAARDATLIERLDAAGAVLLGGLNMGEYAYDFTGENSHYGPSRNPRANARMTGGSSGGSGARWRVDCARDRSGCSRR